MSVGPVPLQLDINAKGGTTASAWRAWFTNLFVAVAPLGGHGLTAARPVGTPTQPIYVGQQYFDLTLGYPVYIKSLNPTVWVNGAGGAV